MASSSSNYEILSLKVTNFNIVVATLGGFLSLFGFVSYLLKEKFYLGEAVISAIAGLIFSPHAANLVRPLEYAGGSQLTLDSITLYFSRLVLGVQLVLAGIQLPSAYLRKEWKSLSFLLGPGMCCMWISTSLLVWAMVPNLNILQALAVGACVTPTDPVLSNSIVKGKFADKNLSKDLQRIIIAESGANDGLGYPFLFLPIYLLRYVHDSGAGQSGGAAKAMGYWFGITWGYEIIFSVVYGALVGWLFKEALHWAEERRYVDRESFLVFAITIALFIVGTLGMLGSDDVLACFIAGNSFTWDDWFRLETEDDSFQPTIDMLLNVSIFAWYGAICPWYSFAHNHVIPIYRLIFLAILVLILRRPPIVFAMHTKIHQIADVRQALFVGYFGPIGVSAIFYLYTSKEYLREITVDGVQREDAARLSETIEVVVWFMVVCSILAHGLSIPLGKLGLNLPRTLSMSRPATSEKRSQGVSDAEDPRETDADPAPLHLRQGAEHEMNVVEHVIHRLFHVPDDERKEQDSERDGQSANGSAKQHRDQQEQNNKRKKSLRLPGMDTLLRRTSKRGNMHGDNDSNEQVPRPSTPPERTVEGVTIINSPWPGTASPQGSPGPASAAFGDFPASGSSTPHSRGEGATANSISFALTPARIPSPAPGSPADSGRSPAQQPLRGVHSATLPVPSAMTWSDHREARRRAQQARQGAGGEPATARSSTSIEPPRSPAARSADGIRFADKLSHARST